MDLSLLTFTTITATTGSAASVMPCLRSTGDGCTGPQFSFSQVTHPCPHLVLGFSMGVAKI